MKRTHLKKLNSQTSLRYTQTVKRLKDPKVSQRKRLNLKSCKQNPSNFIAIKKTAKILQRRKGFRW
jgi:hypothetical protein